MDALPYWSCGFPDTPCSVVFQNFFPTLFSSSIIQQKHLIDHFLTCMESLQADLHGTILSHVISLRHAYDILGHNCRKVLKHVLKSYDFFSCRKRVVRRLHATKSYRVNRPYQGFIISVCLWQLRSEISWLTCFYFLLLFPDNFNPFTPESDQSKYSPFKLYPQI